MHTFLQKNRERFKNKTLTKILTLVAFVWAMNIGWGQVANYTFSQSSGTYTAITGGTVAGASNTTTTLDTQTYGSVPIGFTFVYNGINYTTIGIASDGFISMGSTAPSSSFNPISTGTTNNVISAAGRDLYGRQFVTASTTNASPTVVMTAGSLLGFSVGDALSGTGITTGTLVSAIASPNITMAANATSTGTGRNIRAHNGVIRYETIGTAPYRKLVVQWSKFSRYNTSAPSDYFNFQIILNETTNKIDIIYDFPYVNTTGTHEVGLRGASSSDYNNRSTTTNWNSTTAGSSNAASCSVSNTIFPASGLTFTWTPSTSPYVSATAVTAFGNVCTNTTAGPNSTTITGGNLTGNITLGALAGFSYCTTSGGTYTSTLDLTPSSGSVNQVVYIKFNPTAVQSYSGNIPITGGGLAATVNVAVTGAGINTAPTVSVNGTAGSITTTGATISGSTISALGCSSVTAYGIEYSTTSGFANGTGTQVAGTGFSGSAGGTFSTALSGLSASTTYYYKAYATNSGGTTYYSTQSSFSTLCNSYSVPYNEGFESGYTNSTTVAGCLSQNSITGAEVWTANNSATDYNRSPRTGSWNAYLKYSNEDWLFIPINLTGGVNYTASVYARQDGATSTNSNIAISYGSTNSSAAMTNSIVAATGIINGSYQEIKGTFTPASTGVYYVGIKGFMNGSPWYISIDDISIIQTPNCIAPASVSSTTSITDTSATLNWTASTSSPADGYDWEVRSSGAGGSGSTGLVASGSVAAGVLTANATGLTAATSYTVYVRANCGGADYSTWSSGGAFVSACAIPNAPSNVVTSNVTSTTLTVGYTAASPVPTGYMLFLSTESTTIPTLTNGTTYTAGTNYTIGGIVYRCVASNSTSTSFNLTGGIPNTQHNYFAFSRSSINSCSGAPWYSAGVTGFAITCPSTPTTPTATAITSTGATIGWTTPAGQGTAGTITYTVEVYTDAGYTTHITGSPFTGLATNSQAITGLSASTTYYYRIKANNTFCDSTYLTGSFTSACQPESIDSTTHASRCGSGSVTLGATATNGATVSWYAASTGGTALATGTSFTTPSISATTNYYVSATKSYASSVTTGSGVLTSSSSAISPYYHGYGGAKTQYIFKASELIAMGLTAGNITQLSLNIISLGTTPLNGFSISIGHTSQNAVVTNTAITSGLTSVYSNAAQALTLGTNTYAFSTPFNWNGTSNIVISFSYSNNNGGGTSSSIEYTAAGFTSSLVLFSDNASATCMLNAVSDAESCFDWDYYGNNTSSNRPNITLFGQMLCESPRTAVTATINTPPALTLSSSTAIICNGSSSSTIALTTGGSDYNTYTWSPSTNVSGNETTGWTFNPSATTSYTLTATQTGGSFCTNSTTFTINVNPAPTDVVIATPDATICANSTQTLTATGGIGSNVTVLINETADVLPTSFTVVNTAGTGSATQNTTYYSQGTGSVLFNTSSSSANVQYALNSNIDLTGASSAQLTFSHIAAFEGYINSYDYGYVEYSTNGGSTWTTFTSADYVGSAATAVFASGAVRFSTKSYSDWITQFSGSSATPGTGPATSLWKTETFNIPTAALTSSQFRIRYRYTTDSSTNYYGWLIDNIQLTKSTSIPLIWSPNTNLYTDVACTTAYDGVSSAATLYAKPIATTTYTATATIGSCSKSDTVTFTTESVTYNPTLYSGNTPANWSAAPDVNKGIVIDGNYTSSGNLEGCNCVINSGNVVISSGDNLILINEVNVSSGSLTFENGASLLQTNKDAVNTGNITYNRTSSNQVQYDYTYWGVPVTGAKASVFTNADKVYNFNHNAQQWVHLNLSAASSTIDLVKGVGYISRYTPASVGTQTAPFVGVPNNGDVSITGITAALNNSILLGNPYPSAIDLEEFYEDNNAVLGTNFYYWNHGTAYNGTSYSASDYSIYNAILGASVGSGSGTPTASRYAAAGQGFFADLKAVSNASVVFKNTQRVSGNNTTFFRSSALANTTNNVASDKIWLNLTNANNASKQLLIAYTPNGVIGYDTIDGVTYDAQPTLDFYTLDNVNKLVIQARPSFVNTDMVPMGLRTTQAGTFQISIDHKDAFFNDIAIYVKDNLLNIVHNLATPYSFTTTAGTFDNRFEIIYQGNALGNPDVSFDNAVIVFAKDKNIHINSGLETIKEVVVYDLQGRTITTKTNINATQAVVSNVRAEKQVLLVKVTSTEGKITTKKIVF